MGGWMDGKIAAFYQIFHVYTASIKAKGELDLNQHYSSSSATQPSVDAARFSVNSRAHLSFILR